MYKEESKYAKIKFTLKLIFAYLIFAYLIEQICKYSKINFHTEPTLFTFIILLSTLVIR